MVYGSYSFGIIGLVYCARCDAMLGSARGGYYYLDAVSEIWDADERALLGSAPVDLESEEDVEEDEDIGASDIDAADAWIVIIFLYSFS